MRQQPVPGQQRPARRRGGLRIWVLVAFIAYGAWYWFSNQSVDPVTGENVLIDRSLSADDEKELGLQAYQQILSQERPADPDSPISRQVRNIAERLVAKVDAPAPWPVDSADAG